MNLKAKEFFASEPMLPASPYWYYSPNIRVPNPALKPWIWQPPLHDLPWPVKEMS